MNPLSRRMLLVAAATAVLAGCASSSALVTGTKREPIPVERVKLYTQAPKKYQEIALLESSSRNSWSFTDQAKLDAVILRLKEEAAKLGANGVLLQGTANQGSGAIGTGIGGGGGGWRGGGVGIGVGTSFELERKVGRGQAIWVEEE
jgi:type IV pilus biogenesis protein CpaD/CtpE